MRTRGCRRRTTLHLQRVSMGILGMIMARIDDRNRMRMVDGRSDGRAAKNRLRDGAAGRDGRSTSGLTNITIGSERPPKHLAV